MKSLIAIGTLVLALSFPSFSFASDYMGWLHVKPVVEIRNEIKGGKVEKDFMGFYTSPRTVNTTDSLITADQKSDDEYISVFGVQIPRSSRS
jgi:hypothetical protein